MAAVTPRYRSSDPPEKVSFVAKTHKDMRHLPSSKVLITIEDNSLVLRDIKKRNELARTSFDDIISWASSDGTFAYEVTWESVPEAIKEKQKKRKTKGKNKAGAPVVDRDRTSLRHVFVTKEGAVISDSLKRSVNLVLEREEKKLNEELLQYTTASPLTDSTTSANSALGGDDASVSPSVSGSQLSVSTSAAALLSSAALGSKRELSSSSDPTLAQSLSSALPDATANTRTSSAESAASCSLGGIVTAAATTPPLSADVVGASPMPTTTDAALPPSATSGSTSSAS